MRGREGVVGRGEGGWVDAREPWFSMVCIIVGTISAKWAVTFMSRKTLLTKRSKPCRLEIGNWLAILLASSINEY